MRIAIAPSDFLLSYPFSGEFTVTRNFEDHPSLSGLSFRVPVSQLSATLCNADLQKGATCSVLGQSWRIADRTITVFRDNNFAEISLELVGIHASIDTENKNYQSSLDTPQLVSPFIPSITGVPETPPNRDKHGGMVRLHSLAAYEGRQIDGEGYYVDVDIPWGRPDDYETTTAREQLEKYKRIAHPSGSFIYWSGTNPEFRVWNSTTSHALDSVLISESLTYSEPGTGYVLNCIQLTDELTNSEFQPDDQWLNFPYDVYETLTYPEVGDPFAHSAPDYDDDAVYSGNACYDRGGETKQDIVEQRVNKKLLSRQVRTYGWVLVSCQPTGSLTEGFATHFLKTSGDEIDIVRKTLTFTFASDAWKLVSDVTETYTYDSNGYLVNVEQSGVEKRRWKQESDSQEVATLEREKALLNDEDFDLQIERSQLQGERPNASPERQAEIDRRLDEIQLRLDEIAARIDDINVTVTLYADFDDFFFSSDKHRTTYDLGLLGAHYRDVKTTTANPYKYLKNENKKINTVETRTDPTVNQDNLDPGDPGADPPIPGESGKKLTRGEYINERKETRILSPVSRLSRKREEYTRSKTVTFSQKNAGLKDAIKIETEEPVSEGRPSEHERVIIYGWTKPAGWPDAEDNSAAPLLNTPGTGYLPTDDTNGTYSSPGIVTEAEAVTSASLEMSILNTQNARTVSIEVEPSMDYEEGDRGVLRGENVVILGISQNYQIGVNEVILRPVGLDIGVHLAPVVTLTNQV